MIFLTTTACSIKFSTDGTTDFLSSTTGKTWWTEDGLVKQGEHARVFVFGNQGDPDIYMASADWMNRNLNSRIELCFPIYNKLIKKEVMELLQLQLLDNTKARHLDQNHNNLPIHSAGKRKIRAQAESYKLLKG